MRPWDFDVDDLPVVRDAVVADAGTDRIVEDDIDADVCWVDKGM